MRLLCLLTVLLGAGLPLTAMAAEARHWLDAMSAAMRDLNYQGTFVYLHDMQVETMRIEHGRDDAGEYERLLSLNGEAREVIRMDDQLTCIWPGSKSVTVSKAQPQSPFPMTSQNAAELGKYYRLQVIGEDRVAGFAARVVAIEPRDHYRYGYKLWLEADTNLLLRSDMLDETGQPVEQVVFTQLDLLPRLAREDFHPSLQGQGFTWQRQQNTVEMDPDPMWKVTALPAGFYMSHRDKKPMPPHADAVEHWVFSDGLASVSLFIEPMKAEQKKLLGASRMGGVNVFGRMLGEYQITLVGEVPAATVQTIAKAVVHLP